MTDDDGSPLPSITEVRHIEDLTNDFGNVYCAHIPIADGVELFSSRLLFDGTVDDGAIVV